MKDHKTKTVAIDAELHDIVREYCDRKNIRLVDFVEDSLENAINFHEQSNLAAENKKLLSKIKEKYQTIHKAGFNEGFFVAFFAMKGDLWASIRNQTLKKRLKRILKPVKASQLTLFDDK